jgi:hypothetical protein
MFCGPAYIQFLGFLESAQQKKQEAAELQEEDSTVSTSSC